MDGSGVYHDFDCPAYLPPDPERVAVATLDEAREILNSAAEQQGTVILPDDRSPFTLPDGTVIEVEPTTWEFLQAQTEFRSYELPDFTEILEAFNAQEAKL
jgi:hypothetical protein